MARSSLLSVNFLTRVALVLWLISSVFVLVLLSQIDLIVNGKLYDFGLQFSSVWAQPYWAFFRLVYIFLLIPLVFSAAVLSLGFFRWFVRSVRGSISKLKRKAARNVQPAQSSILIVCSHCGRVFSKPMCILDFSGEKPRLVNVCPYCNARLEKANNHNKDLHVYTKFPESKQEEIPKPS